MKNSLVSIVIPNFNNGPLLKEMIDCIQHQSYKYWELWIVDDGSTDNSVQLVNDYAESDGRIHLFCRNRLPKGGQTCRNIGKDCCRGEYVVFFDSDDLIAPWCLEQRVTFMNSYPEIDYGIFPAHSFKTGNDPYVKQKTNVGFGEKSVKDPLDKFLRNEYPHTVWTNMYRRNSIVDINWDEKVLVRQDFDYNVTNLINGKKYAFCTTAKYDYFYRGAFGLNNVSKSFTTPTKCKSMIYLFDKIISQLEKMSEKKCKQYKLAIRHYIVHHYTSLIQQTNKETCKEYIDFCQQHFDRWFIIRLKVIDIIVRPIRIESLKFIMTYFVTLLLFWYKFYFIIIGKQIRKVYYRL